MNRFLIALSVVVFAHSLSAETVADVLSRMDASAPKFHGMSADITMVTFTSVINDTTSEKGTMEMQKLSPKDVRAVIKLQTEGSNDQRVLAFKGSGVRIYSAANNTYQDYDIGKKGLLNQYLLLGFGSSGKELSESYKISLVGSETVAGSKTSKLQMIPKDPEVLQHLSSVEVWIPENEADPIQQKFYEPSGNYRQVTYEHVQLNPSFGKGSLDFKLPAGARRQQQ